MSGAVFLYGSLIHPPSPLIQQQRYHYLSPPIPIRPLCISPLTIAIVSTTFVLHRDSEVELASSSPSIDSNDAVSPQNETVELETERHSGETFLPPLSSEYKGTRLRKKKEDDVVSDNRFKLRNGREVFEEKAYLVGVERKNDVQDFGIEESLSELAQLADTAGLFVVGSTYQKKMENKDLTHKRWRSSKEQLSILEYIYKGGLTRPSREQIEAIATLLRCHGELETISVYFWFQNQRYKDKREETITSMFLHPLLPNPMTAGCSDESVKSDLTVKTLDLFPIPVVRVTKEVIHQVSKPATEPSTELTLRTPRSGN